MSVPVDPGVDMKLLHSIRFVSYFDVVAAALYIWDYLITFDMEVDLVWRSKWNTMKVLFLVQRYLPFADTVFLVLFQKVGRNLSISDCQQVYQALGWMMLLGTALCEILLGLRAWGVWNREPRATIILCTTFIVLWVPDFGYMAKFLSSLIFGPPPYPHFLGCLLLNAQEILFACFVTIMVWDTVIFIFMVIPGFQAYQHGGNSALFYVVYRDGVIYYLYQVALSCINVVAIRTFPPGTHYLFLSIQRSLHAILASRVLLHIRCQFMAERNNLSIVANGQQGNNISDFHIISTHTQVYDEPSDNQNRNQIQTLVIRRNSSCILPTAIRTRRVSR